MFLGMLTSLLVPESKRARLEELAGEKDDVYELQASGWRNRGGAAAMHGDIEAPTRGSGSATSGRSTDGDVEKKWWKVRQGEMQSHAM